MKNEILFVCLFVRLYVWLTVSLYMYGAIEKVRHSRRGGGGLDRKMSKCDKDKGGRGSKHWHLRSDVLFEWAQRGH